MPDGKTHLKATNRLWLPMIIASVAFSRISVELSFWIVYWFWLERYIDNDLDLQGVTSSESRANKELWLAGALLGSITYLYAWLVAQAGISIGITNIHRSRLTHGLFGTLFRIGLIDIFLAITLRNYITLTKGKYSPATFIMIIASLPISYLIASIKPKTHTIIPNRFRYGVQNIKRLVLLFIYFWSLYFVNETSTMIHFDANHIGYFVLGQAIAMIPPDILHDIMDKKETRKRKKTVRKKVRSRKEIQSRKERNPQPTIIRRR